jgi:hypothetical protein
MTYKNCSPPFYDLFHQGTAVAAQKRHPQPTAPHSGGTVKSNVDESFSLIDRSKNYKLPVITLN